MEKEPIQKSNIKFNFKRGFLVKFGFFAIISALITVLIIIADLNENEASVGETFGMFFTLISFSAILALVINYFHKWIWESRNKKKTKENQDRQNIQEKSSFEKQVGYWALLSLIFGILSLLALPIVHVLAIIFGIIAFKKKENKAFAIAGIVLGGSILIYTIINRLAGL